MERENKKGDVAALHREKILEAAHGLFCRDGFAATSISGLSAASHYSRRTIYAYFESKEDILHHLIEKGLLTLKADLKAAVAAQGTSFRRVSRHRKISGALFPFRRECENGKCRSAAGGTSDGGAKTHPCVGRGHQPSARRIHRGRQKRRHRAAIGDLPARRADPVCGRISAVYPR